MQTAEILARGADRAKLLDKLRRRRCWADQGASDCVQQRQHSLAPPRENATDFRNCLHNYPIAFGTEQRAGGASQAIERPWHDR